MSEKNMKKKKKIDLKNKKMIIVVILLIFMIVGGTLAAILIDITNGNYAYHTQCFNVIYDTGDDITGTLIPSSSLNGGLNGSVTFGIDQSCNIVARGNLFLNVDNQVEGYDILTQVVEPHCEDKKTLVTLTGYDDEASCLANSNRVWVTNGSALKYALYDNTSSKYITVGYISNGNDYINIYNNFQLPASNTYNIYIWLDGELVDNTYQNLSFSGDISAEVEQDSGFDDHTLMITSYTCDDENGNPVTVGDNPYFTYTGQCEVIDDENGDWRIRFLTDGDFTSTLNIPIDVFLVGGGGAGGNGFYGYESSIHYGSGGGGGAGGYTITHKNVVLYEDTYMINVGSGGTSSSRNGETTSAFGFVALGGTGGMDATSINSYGDAGIGGNNGGYGASWSGAGSTPGSDGENGQGRTTGEFGVSTATIYAGGGAGGRGMINPSKVTSSIAGGSGGGGASGVAGTANTGGGGGGGNVITTTGSFNGQDGGSGIVIIRNARENIESSSNNIPKVTYTGMYIIVNDNDEIIGESTDNWKIKFLSSGNLIFSNLGSSSSGIDVFLVGGGGAGGTGLNGYASAHYSSGGGGGGAGYSRTVSNVSVILDNVYNIVVGEGGNGSGESGSISSAFGYEAEGGSGGSNASSFSSPGAGGIGSVNGGAGALYSNVGSAPGNGIIYEFDDTSLKLYAGGGAGGRGNAGDSYSSSVSGGTGGGGASGMPAYYLNSGSGGGGGNGYYYVNKSGKAGASGIVVIRNKR